MKLVLKYFIDGGEECGSFDQTIPFEYESVEKAEYDLLTLWEEYVKLYQEEREKNRWCNGERIFAGIKIDLGDLTYYVEDKLHKRQNPKYSEPVILTLEDWWEQYQENEHIRN